MKQESSSIVALENVFLNVKTGAIYQRTGAGKVLLIGHATYFELAALLAGVDSTTISGVGDIEKLARHYGVPLTPALQERLASRCTKTHEACDLLIAMGRFYALAQKQDPRELSEHREWLQAAMAGLLPEPTWAYRLAHELTGVSLTDEREGHHEH
jgi:hypothetical protein